MPIDWSQLAQWALAPFLGALVVKLLDLFVVRFTRKRELNRDRARTVLAYVRQYGELVELSRFLACVSEKLITADDGQFVVGDDGLYEMKRTILEPEPRFEEAIRVLKGADISTAISQTIASIRLASSDAYDAALELDTSGSLRKRLDELHKRTVLGIEPVIRHKDSKSPPQAFDEMVQALRAADTSRREARAELQTYLK